MFYGSCTKLVYSLAFVLASIIVLCIFLPAGAVSHGEGQQNESSVACYNVPVTEGITRVEWKVVATCVVYQNAFYFSEKEHYSAISTGTSQILPSLPQIPWRQQIPSADQFLLIIVMLPMLFI